MKIEVEEAESAVLNALLSEFEEVFGDDVGEIKDFQVELQQGLQGVVPNFFAQDLS